MDIINDKHYNFYWDNGYLILDNIFSIEEINNIYNILSYHNDKEWNNILNPDREEFLISYNTEKLNSYTSIVDKTNYILRCKSTSKVIRDLLKDKRIVSPLEKLYNSELYGLSTHMIWKKPGTVNAHQSWHPHQDNSYSKNNNGKILTINLFLDDVVSETGAIYNYPGTHKEGLLPHIFGSDHYTGDNRKFGTKCNVPPNYKKIDIEASKGALYIQHGNLIHGSYINQSKHNTRALFSATYIVKGESFYSGTVAKRKEISLRN